MGFRMEILLDGDSSSVFGLFADLCKIFVNCGALSLDETKAAVVERYVVEKRRQHVDSDRAASSVPDVLAFLLNDFVFQARHHVLRVFKLCCLVINSARRHYPPVSFGLPKSLLVQRVVNSCEQMVQSYVLSPGYSHQAFLTVQTLVSVQTAFEDASVFFVSSNFCIWKVICSANFTAFVSQHKASFVDLLPQRGSRARRNTLNVNGPICLDLIALPE